MTEILIKFIPIFLLLTIGAVLRKTGIFDHSFIDGVKKLIVTIALPSTLFLSFLTMELKSSYITLFISTVLFCFVLFGAGIVFRRTGLCPQPFSEFFHTGFEFGMVGVALFSSLFGADQLYAILLLGLGHELFIWFFYVPVLQFKGLGSFSMKQTIRSFLSSPLIIAILAALLLNTTGLYTAVAQAGAIESVIETLRSISALTSPLILIVIGFQLDFQRAEIGKSFKIILLRYAAVLVFGTLFAVGVDAFIMPVRGLMLYAFVTFLLLPPPFVIPVFLPDSAKQESTFYNSTLVIYTAATLIIYSITMMLIL